MQDNNRNSIKKNLLLHSNTHPNLCKLWISYIENTPSSDKYVEAKQMLENIHNYRDFTKLNILSLYALLQFY